MKAQNNPFLTIARISLAAAICMAASASAATNNWNVGDGTWDTSTDNWLSPATWTNGDDAVFSNTASATTITLIGGLTAGSVVVGNGDNNANYTFTGGSLSANSFTVQANGGNNLGTPTPITTLNNTSLSLPGDLGVGRATLVIGGNSTVTADRIGGGGMTGITSADWGQVTIQDTANVTATNGIVGNTAAWGLNLNGGTLTTKGIDYGPNNYAGTTNLNFNGTLVKANQENNNFITRNGPGNNGNAPEIQAGGAKIDTNGFDIGVQLALQGSGALTKSGAGTLKLAASSSYGGGTTIDGGTMIAAAYGWAGGNTALGTAAPTNVITINNGGVLSGAAGTVSNWLDNTALASNGSNAHTVVINTGGTLKGGDGNITGLGNVTLNGGTIEVSNGLGQYGWNGSFTLGGDITVSGSTASAITTSPGAGGNASILMSDGANGRGGTRTFTVNDVTNSAASDLVVSARLALGTVVKQGTGTVEIVAGETGTENPATWEIAAGKFLVANGATFEFRVNNSTSNRVIEASGGTGNAAFNGTLNINTSDVNSTAGMTWPLIDVAGLGATFDPTTFSVAGFDDSNNDGVWTKSDAIGNWSFSEANGELIRIAAPVPTGVLFTDNFDATSNQTPNDQIANPGRQGGSLATLGYLQTGNIQIGNGATYPANSPGSDAGDDMLAAYAGRAYVNYNFSYQTLPLEITFRGLVDSAGDLSDWVSLTVGNNTVPVVTTSGARSILFRANGGTQLFDNGSSTAGASGVAPGFDVWTDYKVVLSDTAGTGSAWGTGGSRADYYANGSFLGTFHMTQLTAGEGYIGFSGARISGYDDLKIQTVGGTNPYTTWAGGFAGFTPTTGNLDFENDGIQNLLEFVLGGNPTTNDSPSILPTVSASGSDLVVTFKRTDLSETEPVAVKVQTSPDLVTWTDFATIGATSDIPSGYTVAENDAAADTIVVTIPKAAATKKFARVSAE